MLSCDYCEILRRPFFIKHLWWLFLSCVEGIALLVLVCGKCTIPSYLSIIFTAIVETNIIILKLPSHVTTATFLIYVILQRYICKLWKLWGFNGFLKRLTSEKWTFFVKATNLANFKWFFCFEFNCHLPACCFAYDYWISCFYTEMLFGWLMNYKMIPFKKKKNSTFIILL